MIVHSYVIFFYDTCFVTISHHNHQQGVYSLFYAEFHGRGNQESKQQLNDNMAEIRVLIKWKNVTNHKSMNFFSLPGHFPPLFINLRTSFQKIVLPPIGKISLFLSLSLTQQEWRQYKRRH